MSPGIAVAPEPEVAWVRAAVLAAGGRPAPVEDAEALIWAGDGAAELQSTLARAPGVRWIQLPSAGVETYLSLMDGSRTWTAAKGVYAEQCAEHALGLAIAGFRHLDGGARRRTWQRPDGKTLFGGRVLIVGGGGIGQALLRLLQPFRVHATVIRRQAGPTRGAERTLRSDQLMDALPEADLVVLALPLTSETERMIGASQLRAMKREAWLVNVARGRLIRTDELVQALREHRISGAGLDVTDPEPLPDGHPLWELDNCIITSHTANPPNLERTVLAPYITENVRRYLAGQPLLGIVDREAGY